jgi:ABC-type Fe3+ transport system permease subunit
VLAIDIYQQVIGQQNFNRGAVVGLILLLPVVVAFAVDAYMQRSQQSRSSRRAPSPTCRSRHAASTRRCSSTARSFAR